MLACRLVVDWQMVGKSDEDEDEDGEIASHVTSEGDIASDDDITTTKGKSKILTRSKKEN
jgi:hypothetical protein